MRAKLGASYYPKNSSNSKPPFGCSGYQLIISTQSQTSLLVTPVTGLDPLIALKKPKAGTHTCLHVPLQNRMDTLLPMAWGKTQKLQAQHMSLAIPPLHFSPKCIRFLCHQLPLLKPPSLGSSSLSSIPQDTSQWLRTRQCLKHPCISSFLMEERGTRSHLLYCAFSLVLADPLCDPIDQILYEKQKISSFLYQFN